MSAPAHAAKENALPSNRPPGNAPPGVAPPCSEAGLRTHTSLAAAAATGTSSPWKELRVLQERTVLADAAAGSAKSLAAAATRRAKAAVSDANEGNTTWWLERLRKEKEPILSVARRLEFAAGGERENQHRTDGDLMEELQTLDIWPHAAPAPKAKKVVATMPLLPRLLVLLLSIATGVCGLLWSARGPVRVAAVAARSTPQPPAKPAPSDPRVRLMRQYASQPPVVRMYMMSRMEAA